MPLENHYPNCFQHFIQCLDPCPTFTSHPNGKIRISVMRYSAIHCRTTHFQEILMKKEKIVLNFIVCSCTFQSGSLARSTGSQPPVAATNYTDCICICMHVQHIKTSHNTGNWIIAVKSIWFKLLHFDSLTFCPLLFSIFSKFPFLFQNITCVSCELFFDWPTY